MVKVKKYTCSVNEPKADQQQPLIISFLFQRLFLKLQLFKCFIFEFILFNNGPEPNRYDYMRFPFRLWLTYGLLRSRLYERNWFTSRLNLKSDCSFAWLGKMVNSSKNQILNYMAPEWLTSVNWFTSPDRLISPKLTINGLEISYNHSA